jgi:hypothetical protein
MSRSNVSFAKARGCRTILKLFRPSHIVAERLNQLRFDQQWRELRRHATIERDPETLLWLADELAKRKRQAEIASKCNRPKDSQSCRLS